MRFVVHHVGQFVDEFPARTFALGRDIFELDEALQVHTQLRVAPVDRLAQGAAAKEEIGACHRLPFTLGHHIAVDQFQQPPRLRR